MYPYQRQSYGPANAIADIFSAFMMRRQMDKDNKAMLNAFNPVAYDTKQTDTNYQFNDTTGQGVKNNTAQGLLPTSFATEAPKSSMLGMMPQGGQGLLQMMPQLGQGAMQMMPQQAMGTFANPMERFSTTKPENQMTTTTTTKELGLPDIQKQIRSEWQKKVQADIKGMSAEGARQYMAAARQTLNEQLGQAKDDYNAQRIAAYVEKLPPELQNAYTMSKLGIPDAIIKRIFPEQPASVANGSWVLDRNTGEYKQIGQTGGMTAYQQYKVDNGLVGGGARSGGGSSARAVDTDKAYNSAVNKVASLEDRHYAWVERERQRTYGTEEPDETKSPYFRQLQLARQNLSQYETQRQEEPAAPAASNGNDIASKVSAARSRGIPDNQIRAALAQDGMSEAEINAVMGVQQQPPPARPQLPPIDITRLDAINNNWQF